MSNKAYVYLICNPATDQYKIGVTKNDIDKRLKQLQVGNGCCLHLVGSHESEHPYYIEKMLHRELMQFRTSGEWFDFHENDTNILEMFRKLCCKYENVIVNMKDNPFFNKMANI